MCKSGDLSEWVKWYQIKTIALLVHAKGRSWKDSKHGPTFILKIIEGSKKDGMEEGAGNAVHESLEMAPERDDEGQTKGCIRAHGEGKNSGRVKEVGQIKIDNA